jgi:hypothetical protein
MVEGGVYSVESGGGAFGVIKILKLEPSTVHVRVYKNKFSSRPTSLKLEELSLGSVKDSDGFGMGHLPIAESEFAGWKPVLVVKSRILEDELEGYKLWKEAGGGVFGK